MNNRATEAVPISTLLPSMDNYLCIGNFVATVLQQDAFFFIFSSGIPPILVILLVLLRSFATIIQLAAYTQTSLFSNFATRFFLVHLIITTLSIWLQRRIHFEGISILVHSYHWYRWFDRLYTILLNFDILL